MTEIETELYLHYERLMGAGFCCSAPAFRFVRARELVRRYDAFFFDAFGTLVNRGGFVYPGAREFVAGLLAAGKFVGLVTNAASQKPSAVAADFAAKGFAVPAGRIWTSGRFVAELRAKYSIREAYCLGRQASAEMLEASGIRVTATPSEPTVICCSCEKVPEKLLCAEEILRRKGALLLVLNPDALSPELDGTRMEVSGVQGYRLFKSTHCLYEPCGKPFANAFAEAIAAAGPGARCLMVGDTLGTDVVGAAAAGIDSCLILGRNVLERELETTAKILGVAPTFCLRSFE